MIRRSLLGVVVFSSLMAAVLSAQSVDEIVARNIEAKGGLERLRAIKTVKQTGTLLMGAGPVQFVVYGKRPGMIRQELTLGPVAGSKTPRKLINAFDGKVAWIVNPILGVTSPMTVMGEQAEQIRQQSNFDGPLIDYKAQGYRVEFIGSEPLDGRRVNHLQLTDRSKNVQQLYLDVETGLEAKLVVMTPTGSIEQQFSDYRDVEGVKVPFVVQVVANGIQQSKLTFEKIEFNVPIDDAMFRMRP